MSKKENEGPINNIIVAIVLVLTFGNRKKQTGRSSTIIILSLRMLPND